MRLFCKPCAAEIGCNVADVVPATTDEAANLFEHYDMAVMGGTKPGHTTGAVSVAFAEMLDLLMSS